MPCNKPQVNGNAAIKTNSLNCQRTKALSHKYNGRISCLSAKSRARSRGFGIDLKCGLETSDGDKVDGKKIGKMAIEHNEEDDDFSREDDYDVVYEFRSTRKVKL